MCETPTSFYFVKCIFLLRYFSFPYTFRQLSLSKFLSILDPLTNRLFSWWQRFHSWLVCPHILSERFLVSAIPLSFWGQLHQTACLPFSAITPLFIHSIQCDQAKLSWAYLFHPLWWFFPEFIWPLPKVFRLAPFHDFEANLQVIVFWSQHRWKCRKLNFNIQPQGQV